MVAQTKMGEERIGEGANGRRMSVVEFESHSNWDDAFRFELLDGVLIVSPAPSGGERHPSEWLARLFWRYHDTSKFGYLIDETVFEHDLRTSRGIRRVDRAVWIGLGREPNPRSDVPSLLIEFVSEGRRNAYRDYVEKRDEYLVVGVREYWVIDRFDRTLTVFSGSASDFSEQVIHEHETYTTPLLPEFTLSLHELLRVADKYSND